jgi:hypothetical protein
VRCGFLLIYAPKPYSAVFLLHTPAPIKIGFDIVQCGSCGFLDCVSEAYTLTWHSIAKHSRNYKSGFQVASYGVYV